VEALREYVLQNEQARLEAAQAEAQARAGQSYMGEVQADFRSDEQAFAAAEPSYQAAADFLRDSRVAEHEMLGATPAEARRMFFEESMELIDQTFARGRSPAELVFALARQRGSAAAGAADTAAPWRRSAPARRRRARCRAPAGGRPRPGMSPEARLANLSGDALRDAWRKIKAGR
jgi:hypothetical protein